MTTTFTTSSLSPSKSSPLIASPPSLAHAQYGDDRVNLHIFIDHFKDIDSTDNGSVKLDAKLNESRRILDFVDGFSWKFGEKIMHYWTGNVGLQEQWLEVWWPSSDDEFAFVVEDDLEISLLYYKFLRDLIVNYYYNASNFNPSINGASLQRRRFVPGAFLEALATADFNISVSGQYSCKRIPKISKVGFSIFRNLSMTSRGQRGCSRGRGNTPRYDQTEYPPLSRRGQTSNPSSKDILLKAEDPYTPNSITEETVLWIEPADEQWMTDPWEIKRRYLTTQQSPPHFDQYRYIYEQITKDRILLVHLHLLK
ncbi:hypothetical protein HYC85_031113 [Camellia sinensis]|uniref:Glycosyl transferase 64 domain-containing protein n=1 Tax=Camellia sinensis TaxID=4442 RepID=A0A7J7FPT7_CAMSI|nr:hypothetical protein HYC85_031113 [Camellia sinensis]